MEELLEQIVALAKKIGTASLFIQLHGAWSVGARLLREQHELKTLQRAERVKRLRPCPRKASAETESNRLIALRYLCFNENTGKLLTNGKKASARKGDKYEKRDCPKSQ